MKNIWEFYYYSIKEGRHYTDEEYGKMIGKLIGNNLSNADIRLNEINKRLQIIQYIKDDKGNAYYNKDKENTLIDFDDKAELEKIYQYQTEFKRRLEHQARQDNIV